MKPSMRALCSGPLVAILFGGALAVGNGCGNNVQGNPGGGRGGAVVGSGGTGGRGGVQDDGGAGGAPTDGGGGGAGSGGGASGMAGEGGTLTPQQVHDGLLNAPTAGGVDVTRNSSISYPRCQP